ncbi:integrin alpha-PS3 [Anabrus simplex]|uniref:integrin alpha-PS3 n=1 Tax=Anabrus simplex TaxID=316456 RepID=UPI0035A2E3EE
MSPCHFHFAGYSVGSGKFRKDKILYVGSAPRAAAYKGKVFVLDIVGSNHTIVQEIDGRQMGEYFGASLCIVDLNGDGLDDLLVGAPQNYVASYWDTGAVYVLMNNAKDGVLREKFKISGEDENGARFGMSISSIGDINKDGYVDVAVGAPYESGGRGAVYLYHGSEQGINPRYKQRLTAATSSFPLRGFGMSISRGLDVDGNSYNDVAVGAYDSANAVLIKSYPVVTIHPRLSASVSKITPTTTLFTVTCCLSYEEAGASNMELEPIEISTIMELDKTYGRATSKSARKRYHFSQVLERPREQKCKEFLVYLQPPRGTQYDAKPIEISVKCTVPVQSRQEFCKNCPVVDPEREIRSQLKIPVDLLCGKKTECFPDLVLQAEFVNIFPPYVIGSTNVIIIKMRLENKMEPAYNTQFNISVTEACRFRRIPTLCQVPTKGQLMCTVDRPLLQHDKFFRDLELDVSNLPTNFSLLQVNITAESLGSEQNAEDNYVRLSLPVKHDVDILMRGKSEPSQKIYQDEDSEEDRLVSHIYEIHNFGVTPAREIQVEVIIPTAMCINTTFVNVVNLDSSQNIMDGPIFRCIVGTVNMTGNCQGNTRDTAAVLHVDCDMINVQCARVVCSGGPLLSSKGHLAIISFRPQLEEVKTRLSKKNIVVHSVAQTRILDFADSLDDRLLIESVSTVFQWKEEHRVDIWTIVGAVLGGLLLLLLICFILYKLGFFERKRKMEMQQALLNKNGTPSDDLTDE